MHRRLSSGLRKRLLKARAERIKAENSLLKEYVSRIVSRYPSSAVLLFGSRARGDHLPYSDYDLAVVLSGLEDKILIIEELRRLKPRGLPLDLIVVDTEELKDPLVKNMFKGAKVLYNKLGVDLET